MKSRNGGAPPPPTLLTRAEALYRDMQGLLRDVLARKKVPASHAGKLRLLVEAELSALDDAASPGEARVFAERLLTRLHILAQEVAVGDQPFPPGRVRCFWCSSFDCPHSRPPEPRSVFRGYSPTGQPLWTELGSLALEEQHPNIEDIYRDRPSPITLLTTGSALSRNQLTVYGKHSEAYRLLAQVAFGYLPLRVSGNRRSQQALTVQAVETHVGRLRFHVNVIGVLEDGRSLGPFLEEVTDSRLVDALASARGKLAELSLVAPDRGDVAPTPTEGGSRRRRRRRSRSSGFRARERKAHRILQRLAQTIERIYRQNTRRTRHAQTRHRDRERPASTALRDALQAQPESILRDVQRGTWVVLGPRSRVHIFNDGGRHVTSVSYSGESIRRRTSQGKWKSTDDEQRERFRSRLSAPAS